MQWQIDFGDRPWHRWFAWFPVRLIDSDTKVWWEYVERQTQCAQGYKFHHYRQANSRKLEQK